MLVLAVLVLVFDPILASAITMMTRPTPITRAAANPPSIHQIAFDFFAGGAGGEGVHCGGGGGGGAVDRGGTGAGGVGR